MDSFDYDELLLKYRHPLLVLLVGFTLAGFGVFIFKSGVLSPQTKIEVLDATTESQRQRQTTVEISGSVIKPGVYKMTGDSRVEDLIIAAGGFSSNADRTWTEKYLNRAAKLADGQKIYILARGPFDSAQDEHSNRSSAKNVVGDQSISSNFSSDSSDQININSASLSRLDTLPGIGQVYGQSIIDHRPYSTVEELVSKGALKKSVYEKIKDLVTVY